MKIVVRAVARGPGVWVWGGAGGGEGERGGGAVVVWAGMVGVVWCGVDGRTGW